MSDSSVPGIVFTPVGAVIPDESAILAGVLADYNAAFGGLLNTSLSTPQGQLASSTAAIIGNKNDQFVYFLNQIDPATASGFMQDAIGKIYFLDRLPATATTVQVDCYGLTGTVIPVGASVVDLNGLRYLSTQSGVIPAGGFVTLTFQATETGPIQCPPSAITSIYQVVPGWDSATNTGAGIVGTNVESRADFEYRRQQSVALNAVGTLPSIYAAAFNVDGVLDVYVAENVTSASIVVGGQTLVAHSVYVAAVGGVALDIATAIWKKKSVGGDWNGNTSVVVGDSSGYDAPIPTYTVKFQIPDPVPIKFAVQIANSATLPSDIVTLVKNAIINAFFGGDGGQRARIGSTLYASRFYAPVAAASPTPISILSILLGTTTPTLNALTLDIGQAPTVTDSDITVTVV